MTDSTRYLNALVNNDVKTINEIYEQFYPNVKRYILHRSGQEVDAEDIFQQVLLQISVRYRKQKFEVKADFGGYLFIACANRWVSEVKKRSTRVTTPLHESLKDDAVEQSLALLQQERWEVFKENLDKISESCRKVLKLFFAKTPYKKIVTEMGYSSETVARQRVFKCKAMLTESIKNDPRYNSLKEL